MIVMLSDEQLEQIEDSLQSAIDVFAGREPMDEMLGLELLDALHHIQATRAAMNA